MKAFLCRNTWKAAPPFIGALLLALGLPARATSNFNLGAGAGGGAAGEYSWNGAAKVLTINDGADITLSGDMADGTRIEVAAHAVATVTLVNVSLDLSGRSGVRQSPLQLNAGARVTLKIMATNILTAGDCDAAAAPAYCAGIAVPASAALSIHDAGMGELEATGGQSGAGIGGGLDHTANPAGVGTIAIHGGKVAATGGSNGSGIGGGNGSAGGNITITGGKVTATGGAGAVAGIGGGSRGARGALVIRGGAVTSSPPVPE